MFSLPGAPLQLELAGQILCTWGPEATQNLFLNSESIKLHSSRLHFRKSLSEQVSHAKPEM